MKRLVADLAADNPHVVGNLFNAVSNVLPTHLLDRDLWRRLNLVEATETAGSGEPDLVAVEQLVAGRRE